MAEDPKEDTYGECEECGELCDPGLGICEMCQGDDDDWDGEECEDCGEHLDDCTCDDDFDDEDEEED